MIVLDCDIICNNLQIFEKRRLNSQTHISPHLDLMNWCLVANGCASLTKSACSQKKSSNGNQMKTNEKTTHQSSQRSKKGVSFAFCDQTPQVTLIGASGFLCRHRSSPDNKSVSANQNVTHHRGDAISLMERVVEFVGCVWVSMSKWRRKKEFDCILKLLAFSVDGKARLQGQNELILRVLVDDALQDLSSRMGGIIVWCASFVCDCVRAVQFPRFRGVLLSSMVKKPSKVDRDRARLEHFLKRKEVNRWQVWRQGLEEKWSIVREQEVLQRQMSRSDPTQVCKFCILFMRRSRCLCRRIAPPLPRKFCVD